MKSVSAGEAFQEFVHIIKALRTPQTGCPWDLEQTHQTLRPYLVEETYEVLDTIDAGDDPALCEELGDLLLQVVLHAQLAADREAFSISEVIAGIAEKMVRRHPHVFGSERVENAAEVVQNWDRLKEAEKGGRGGIDDLPTGLPALMRAQRLGEKAAKRRLDPSLQTLITDMQKGVAELADGATSNPRARLEPILGDVLFTLCQVARRLGIGAEDALRASTQRFVRDAESRPS